MALTSVRCVTTFAVLRGSPHFFSRNRSSQTLDKSAVSTYDLSMCQENRLSTRLNKASRNDYRSKTTWQVQTTHRGGGNANALRGTETSRIGCSASSTCVAATPTPYGALKLDPTLMIQSHVHRGGNANALRGTETKVHSITSYLSHGGGNANALRGTETATGIYRLLVVYWWRQRQRPTGH